jgi:hypothetical protein
VKCRVRRLACVSVTGNSSEGPPAPGVHQGAPTGRATWSGLVRMRQFFYLDRERSSRLTAEMCVLASSMEVQPVTACAQVTIGL